MLGADDGIFFMRCILSGRGLKRKTIISQFSTFLDRASVAAQYSACTWKVLFVPVTDSQSDKEAVQDPRDGCPHSTNCYDVILWLVPKKNSRMEARTTHRLG